MKQHITYPYMISVNHLSHVQYSDVIMGTMASQITGLTIVYWTVYSGADQRKHQSSVSLAFVRRIHREPVNSPHKWPVTRKMFPFDDAIRIHYGPLLKQEVKWMHRGVCSTYHSSLEIYQYIPLLHYTHPVLCIIKASRINQSNTSNCNWGISTWSIAVM